MSQGEVDMLFIVSINHTMDIELKDYLFVRLLYDKKHPADTQVTVGFNTRPADRQRSALYSDLRMG